MFEVYVLHTSTSELNTENLDVLLHKSSKTLLGLSIWN